MSDEDLRVEVTLWPDDAPEKALRQIALGINPFILLEIDFDDDDTVVYKINGSMLESNAELLESLESFTDVLRAAIGQEESSDD